MTANPKVPSVSFKVLRLAYDGLSQSLTSYTCSATGSELAKEVLHLGNSLARAEQLTSHKPRKGSATELFPRFLSLVQKAKDAVASHSEDKMTQYDEAHAKRKARKFSPYVMAEVFDVEGNAYPEKSFPFPLSFSRLSH